MEDNRTADSTAAQGALSPLQWRLAFDAIQDMVMIVSPERTVLYANQAMKDLFGQDLTPGQPCCKVVHGTAQPPPDCVSCSAFESGLPSQDSGVSTVLKDRKLELGAYPVKDDRGKVLFLVHTFRDITEQKLREADLQAKQRFNDLLLDTIPHPALVIRRDRTILSANRRARERGAIIGCHCWRTLGGARSIPDLDKRYLEEHGCPPPSGTHCLYCRAEEAMSGGKTTSQETKSGKQHFEIWWVPMDDDCYLHYAVDITEHKRMLDELQKAKELLEERVKERTADLIQQRARLRSLASQLSLAEERERRRIATELHDRVSQALAMCKVQVAELRKSMPAGDFRSGLAAVEDAVGRQDLPESGSHRCGASGLPGFGDGLA